jgi:hypothetical protein
MARRKKGRRVQPAQPGERRQYQPGQLATSLDPVVRQNIEGLAVIGLEENGRGALMVTISAAEETGIVEAQYIPIMQLVEMGRAVPFADGQPISQAVKRYNPEREFVAVVLDVTPSLPSPQMWFDVFPRQGTRKPGTPLAHKQRGRKEPTPPPDQERAMAVAYTLLEDMARNGFAKHGRGFLFYAVHKGKDVEPFIEYMTLERGPGEGFAETAPDLVEYVRTYDPQTSFVVFDAVVNMKTKVLEEVQIDVMTFLTGKTMPSA